MSDGQSRLNRVMNTEYFGYLGLEWGLLALLIAWVGLPSAVVVWALFFAPGAPNLVIVNTVTIFVLAVVVAGREYMSSRNPRA